MAKQTERRVEYMPLAQVKPAKLNSKEHDIGAIHESVGEFGFVEPITVDERTGRLLAGHGRLEALQQMERKQSGKPPDGVKVADDGSWLVPVVRGYASKNDRAARAYLIASNRISEIGGWNEPALSEELKELARTDSLRGTGYDAEDLEAMVKRLSTDLGFIPTTNQFQIVLTCESEQQQVSLLERFGKEGLRCRALVA